jgi:type VII secretion integral membrane protein EccD
VTASGIANGLCRLVIRAPKSAFELTVPTDVRIADLLPTVVGYAGSGLDEAGLEHGGWILQKLGGAALDEESTTAALELHHGDVLYLRPRNDELPPVHFDDLVDGIASSLRQRGDSWRSDLSRRLLLASVLTLLGTGLLVLALSGPPVPRIGAATLVGLLLLAGAASAARAVGDRRAGTAFGLAALPFISLAAGLLPSGNDPDLLGARLLAGGAAGTGMAAVAVAVVGASAAVFLAVGVATTLVAVGGLVMVLGLPLGHAAAAVVVVAIILGTFVPQAAFSLSGMRLPPLPGNSEQLQEGIEPHDAAEVMSASVVAEQYVTALNVALAVVYTACLTGLLADHGRAADTLLLVLGALALLHGRSLGSVPQHLTMMLPGGYAIVLFVVRLGMEFPAQRLIVIGGALLLASGLAVASWTVPGKRMLPHWGQAANLAHTLVAVSVLPLVLVVFGLYGTLRGI